MKYLFTLLFLNIVLINFTIAQELEEEFNWTPFKYSKNDLPFTFGGGPTSGIGPLGPAIGFTLDFDFYHILIGVRLIMYGFPATSLTGVAEKSIFLGYQFRLSKIMLNFGYGVGTCKYMCRSGLNSDCYSFKEEIIFSNALKVGFDFLFSPYSSVGITYNSSTNERSTVNATLIGLKLGLFRHKDIKSQKVNGQ